MSKFKYKFGYALVLLVSLFFISSKNTYAETILFEDNFDDGNASGWSVTRNTCSANWLVNNMTYGININSPCITETMPTTLSIPSTAAYSFEVDLNMTNSINMDRNFVFKYLNSSNWYGIHTFGNNVYLHKVINGTEYFLSNWHTYYPFANNQTYHFKVVVTPEKYDIFVNGNFHASIQESGVTFLNSRAGLQASAGSGVTSSQVWFDNVKITLLDSPTPLPTPSLTPTPEPTLTPTSPSKVGFELPFDYTGRPTSDKNVFLANLNNRLTAVFDHNLTEGIHIPFTGDIHQPASFNSCDTGIGCYDSHNGTDFSANEGISVFSVAPGNVVFTSIHDNFSCNSELSFGCVIILKHPGNIYTLYAHLNKIFVEVGSSLTELTIIGEMGSTGGNFNTHLHFGVLRPTNSTKDYVLSNLMSKRDWYSIISQTDSDSKQFRPFCTYRAPNGAVFSFLDPFGWKNKNKDPWSLPRNKGGCGINSKYLWKFDVGDSF